MKRSFIPAALLILCALLSSTHGYAQRMPHVKLGYIDATALPLFQILGNPNLTCKEGNCEVLSYTLRISRRDRDTYGPYYVTGSEIPENVQRVIKHINVRRGKMYFENIRVRYNGQEMALPDDFVVPYFQDADRRYTTPGSASAGLP